MKRAALTGLIAIALLASGCEPPPPAEAPFAMPDGTSVVMITVDTLRPDHLGLGGNERPTSPYLDSLASEAVWFARAYAQSSWTLPSMLSLFSSLAPAVFGVTEGVTPIPKPGKEASGDERETDVMIEYFSEQYETLTEVLAAGGFATAGFSTNGHLRVEQGFAQGFDVFDQTSCMWGLAECVFAEAEAWLAGYAASKPERPFFLWVHLFDPHFDERRDRGEPFPLYRPPPGYRHLFPDDNASVSLESRIRRDYDRKIRYADDQIRRFVEGLRSRGALDDLILVIAADHGEEFNEKGRWGHSKAVTHTLVHVPLLFRFPEGRGLRGRVDAPVRNVDIAPTLFDALGLEKPTVMRGTSLLPLVRGEKAGAPTAVYGETRRFQHDRRFWIDVGRDRKLVLDVVSGATQLYDASDDPGEERDLSQVEPEVAAALERDLRTAIAEMESRAAPSSEEGSLSAEELEHLRALGYL